MLQQRSTPFASRTERPRLAPPWAIAAVSALVLGLLVVIFPQQALIRRIVASTEESELATAYLANLLRAEPDNPELRLVLARQQYRLGRLAAAEATLRVALASPQQAVREDAAWLLWRIRARELDRLETDSPLRPQALAALRTQLRELAGQVWSERMTLDLAQRALILGESELGLRLLGDLAQRRSDSGPALFNQAALEALGQQQYRAASSLYFAARMRATTLGDRRQAYIAGLRALQQGNLMDEAVAAGERELKDLGDDREALYALVEVARAANRIDIADKYARRMLRLSLLDSPIRTVWHFRLAAAGSDDLAQLPFDDKTYRLGYEVFLNNRKAEDAYRVAAAAVRQVPRDLAWRERLAQVAEWSGKPRVALENWRYLAERSGRDDYWQNVLRLAPGLFEDEALLAALQHELAKTPDDPKLQTALVDTYERLGRPRDGLNFLQDLQRRSSNPQLLEAIAGLAERSGELETALTAWRQRLRGRTPTPAQALRAATLMLQMGRLDEAIALLDSARLGAQEGDVAYWRLSGELARLQQHDGAALDAYRRIIAGGMGEAGDYLAAVALLRDSEPLAAARAASAGWRKFHRLDLFQSSLDLLASQGRWREVGELLAEADATQRSQLLRRPEFLLVRARYQQHEGNLAAARRDLESALSLAPQTPALRQGLIWLAIDGNDAVALRRTLTRHERGWAADPAMHDALAAAWLALSLPQKALDRYLRPHLGEHRDDFLWLMNYADALEQNQESERAWSLRRALLADAARRRDGVIDAEGAAASARRVARDRLAMTQGGGEARLAALRDLLRLDRGADGRPSAAAREAVLSWYQDAGEYTAERAYLWQQYGRNLTRPLWADIAAAAGADDAEALAEVLARGGERLSRYDRIAAAMRTGDWRGAQSDAFDTAGVQGNDDQLQRQMSDILVQQSDSITLGLAARDLGSLSERESVGAAEHVFSPDLRLAVEVSRNRRYEHDAKELAAVPERENLAGARLRLRGGSGETRVGVAARESLRAYRSVLVEREQGLGDGFSLDAWLGLHVTSAESTALRVAGMKDQFELALHYRSSEGERASLQWGDARYFGQTGSELGRGDSWQGELGVPLWLETPDLEVSAFASQYSFSRRQAVGDEALQALVPAASGASVTELFIPAGFRFGGLRLSSNMRYQGTAGEYSRPIRPYAAAAWTHHSTLGAGYDLSLGLAGSVVGGDRLSFGYSLSKGGSGTYGHVRELGLYYQQHF